MGLSDEQRKRAEDDIRKTRVQGSVPRIDDSGSKRKGERLVPSSLYIVLALGIVTLTGLTWYMVSSVRHLPSLEQTSTPSSAPTAAAPATPAPGEGSPPAPQQPTVTKRPKLDQVDRQAATDALDALKALESVTEVGVTYQDYLRRLGDAKIAVDRASRKIKNQELQLSLAEAMLHYQIVGEAWDAKIRRPAYASNVGDYVRIAAKDCRHARELLDSSAPIGVEVRGVSTLMTCASGKIAEVERVLQE